MVIWNSGDLIGDLDSFLIELPFLLISEMIEGLKFSGPCPIWLQVAHGALLHKVVVPVTYEHSSIFIVPLSLTSPLAIFGLTYVVCPSTHISLLCKRHYIFCASNSIVHDLVPLLSPILHIGSGEGISIFKSKACRSSMQFAFLHYSQASEVIVLILIRGIVQEAETVRLAVESLPFELHCHLFKVKRVTHLHGTLKPPECVVLALLKTRVSHQLWVFPIENMLHALF